MSVRQDSRRSAGSVLVRVAVVGCCRQVGEMNDERAECVYMALDSLHWLAGAQLIEEPGVVARLANEARRVLMQYNPYRNVTGMRCPA